MFTKQLVGVDLLEKYNASKDRSLRAFLGEAPRADSLVLLESLMREWDVTRRDNADKSNAELSDSCWKQLRNLQRSTSNGLIGAQLETTGFTSEYLEEQRNWCWRVFSDHLI